MIPKIKKRYKTLILLFFAVYFVAETESCNQNQDEKLIESHPTIYSGVIPNEYVKLFKPQVRSKLKLIKSFEHIGRDTVSNFLYDGKYYVQIYKLSRAFDHSLKTSLKENYSQNKHEVGTLFYENQISLINILNRIIVSKNDTPEKIFISLYGRDYQVYAKDDSVADYHLIFKDLSVNYKFDGQQEIFAEASKFVDETIPLELMFIKQNKKLYLLFLSPKEGSILYPKTLYNLIVN